MANGKMQRICFILRTLNLGGIGRNVLNMSNELLNRGYSVDLFLIKAEGDYLMQLNEGVRLFYGNRRIKTSVASFVKYLNRERPDIILSSHPETNIFNIIGCNLTKYKGNKSVLVVQTNLSYDLQMKKSIVMIKILKWINKIVYRKADKIIAVSNGVASNFCELTRISKHKVRVVGNGVSLESVQKMSTEKIDEDWINKAINNNIPIILGIGRLNKQKDFKTLILAYNKVRKKRESKLLILGEGNERHQLQKLINNLELNDHVKLLGFVTNPFKYLSIASVFVLSSRWEGFGNVIIEALSLGIPVVSTDCPYGPSDILNDGKYGVLVPVGDSGGLADGIINMIENPFDRSKLINRANEYSIPKITEMYLALFNE